LDVSGKNFPIKVKAVSPEGQKFDLFMGFGEPNPEDKETDPYLQNCWAFFNRKDHLYKISRPRSRVDYFYVTIRGVEPLKIEMKIFFSDVEIEKFRKRLKEKHESEAQRLIKKKIGNHQMLKGSSPLKNTTTVVKFSENNEEREFFDKKHWEEEIKLIQERRQNKMKQYYNVNMLVRNIQMVANNQLAK
jgi:hypothetical protein